MSQYRDWAGVIAHVSLGAIFLIAGAGKLLSQSGGYVPFIFPSVMPIVGTVYVVLPYVEIVIGLLLICGVVSRFAASISALLIIGFIAINLYLLSTGAASCGSCFGVAGGLSIFGALFLDVIMAGLVIGIFTCYRRSFFNISPWFLTGHTATRGA